jgi:hypothetical protein
MALDTQQKVEKMEQTPKVEELDGGARESIVTGPSRQVSV